MSEKQKSQIAIIGGGRMGCGIAFIFSASGYPVNIFEPSAERREQLPAAMTDLCTLLEVDRDTLGPLVYSGHMEQTVRAATLVIEAAPENLELKQSIFAELDRYAPVDAVLATNTSAIPISQVAQNVVHKERVVGAHFWNPPHLIEIVEVILGETSSKAAAHAAMFLLTDVGMTPVLVKKDVPGFIGNRLQHALKREAIAIVAEGVCDAETLDIVAKKSFGARLPVMGPLEQSDLLGLELTLAVHKTLMPDLDVTPVPHPYLVSRIEAGKTGAKVGEGFRKWTDAQADAARRKMDDFLVENAKIRYQRK